MEQFFILGAYYLLAYPLQISLFHAQCVTERCGYLWNPQRVFKRHLKQQNRIFILFQARGHDFRKGMSDVHVAMYARVWRSGSCSLVQTSVLLLLLLLFFFLES